MSHDDDKSGRIHAIKEQLDSLYAELADLERRRRASSVAQYTRLQIHHLEQEMYRLTGKRGKMAGELRIEYAARSAPIIALTCFFSPWLAFVVPHENPIVALIFYYITFFAAGVVGYLVAFMLGKFSPLAAVGIAVFVFFVVAWGKDFRFGAMSDEEFREMQIKEDVREYCSWSELC
jgi:hypothetical protein